MFLFLTNQCCIGCDYEANNILGKGVILYKGFDDYTSQPIGFAGAPIICAGIIQ